MRHSTQVQGIGMIRTARNNLQIRFPGGHQFTFLMARHGLAEYCLRFSQRVQALITAFALKTAIR